MMTTRALVILALGAPLVACVSDVDGSPDPGSGSSGSGSGSGSDGGGAPATWATVGQTLEPNAVSLALPPRMQWEANDGYCGELSFAIAGLYFGQYLSQYDARALATPGVAQSSSASQLLLDDNEGAAATAMKLSYEIWSKSGSPDGFLAWTKAQLLANHPVILGIFENTKVFDFAAEAGDDYDHIVPVVGFTSVNAIASPGVDPADQLVFTDNGDYAQSVTGSQLTFGYPRSHLVYDRAHEPANQPYYLNDGEDSAIAILGISDPDGETVPVQLALDTTSEQPEMVDGSSARPAAKPVTLTITVSNLTPGTAYTLYKYTSFAAVPESGFAAHAADAAAATPITIATGSTFTTTETIMSNEIAIYRAVKR